MEDDNLTKKEKIKLYLWGVLWVIVLILIVGGLYCIHTPLEYCEYPLCIKIGVK